MNTRRLGIFFLLLCSLAFLAGSVWAEGEALQVEAAKALEQAMAKLDNPKDTQNLICLTNSGYAIYQGKGTRTLCKTVRDVCGLSADTGNILFVHTDLDAPLYFAVAHKTGPTTLPMVLVSQEGATFKVSGPMDVYAKKGVSMEDFKSFGRPAFSVVSIANGWANGFPEDLIQGALYHDHLCGGVATGVLTVSYIKKKLPLTEGQRYTYVGAPGWCQDDYIATAMNLTPGKRGYLSMKYPWDEAWKTADKEYSSLGGLVIRYNEKTRKGDASLLKFDWKRDELVKFINDPDFDMNQKGNPLLHVYYLRFYLAEKDHPETFLSVIATRPINSQEDLDRLIGMGANPLEEMLGKRVAEAK